MWFFVFDTQPLSSGLQVVGFAPGQFAGEQLLPVLPPLKQSPGAA
jgi:hypothetical protein